VLLIGALFLVVLPLLRRSHTSGLSNADRATATKAALGAIDRGEVGYRVAHQRFTSHLADLVAGDKKLAGDLAVGLAVELDVSSNGNSYLVQVESSVLSLVRARTGSRTTANNSQIVKKGSGVDCSPLAAWRLHLGLWRACPHKPYDPNKGIAIG
jgi:hypothetical protein